MNYRVLICEDDFILLRTIEYILKKRGLETIVASDGRMARQLIDNEVFDLMITDIHMPYFSGLELVRYIREVHQNDMPVIVLSRVGLEETKQDAFDLGATDYLTKPFNPVELSECVSKALKIK